MLIKRVASVFAFALVLTSNANAIPMLYTDIGGSSTSFDTAAANAGLGLTVDGFEDLGAGLIDYGTDLARNGYSIETATGPGLRSSDSFNLIEGNRSMITYNDSDPLTFTFDSPVHAFGITFKDFDMSFGGLLTVSIDGGAAQTLLSGGDGDNLDYFFGAIDELASFSTISFDRTAGDGYNFDIVNYSTNAPSSVPEPTSLALLGIGLAGLSLKRRKRN